MKIDIQSFAERERNLEERKKWGDYWVQQHLESAFLSQGVEIGAGDCLLYLYGLPMPIRPARKKIVWIYSHPDRCDFEFIRQFDEVYCLSQPFISELAKHDIQAKYLIGATNRNGSKLPQAHDIVFVGNSRGNVGRAIINDLYRSHKDKPLPYKVEIWGWGWDNHEWYAGPYYPNESLHELYGSSAISLNDHHGDMSRWGFVAVKIFDILASWGFCISDTNAGISGIFGASVPQYQGQNGLRSLVDFYMENPEQREGKTRAGKLIARGEQWEHRAEEFVEAFQ